MSTCFSPQELQKNKRSVGGVPIAALLKAMRDGGVDLCGLGVANTPLLSLLPSLGIRIRTARDRGEPTPALLAAIRASGARPLFGEGYLAGLSAPVILRTPSLRPDLPELTAARARGVSVLTEVALVLALAPAEILAVTGSDGKTTTAMMTAAILKESGRRVFLGGNIGTPLVSRLAEMRAEDAAVLELSSFQLADLDPPCGRVAITNLTENHLNWHTDMREYAAAKARILGGGTAVLPEELWEALAPAAGRSPILVTEGEPTAERAVLLRGDTVLFREGDRDEVLFARGDLPLCGLYNLKNAMTAAALTRGLAPPLALRTALSRFRGAPHRAEYLGTVRGVRCYDSSIDTTPARTAATLSAFERPTVLLGGRGKNLSFLPLAEALVSRASAAVLSGECADKIREALAAVDPEGRLPYREVPEFREAVEVALALAGEGGTLLLSPAATAFDRFPDYRARGRAFAAILKEVSEEGV